MRNQTSNLTETVKGMLGDRELCDSASHEGALWMQAVGTLVVKSKSCTPVSQHSTWDQKLPSDLEAAVACPVLLTNLPAMQSCFFLLICCHIWPKTSSLQRWIVVYLICGSMQSMSCEKPDLCVSPWRTTHMWCPGNIWPFQPQLCKDSLQQQEIQSNV